MRSTGSRTLISFRFSRCLKKLGIKQKGKSSHSFQHTVVNKLSTQQVYEPFIKELVDHSHDLLMTDFYGVYKLIQALLTEYVIKIQLKTICGFLIDVR